MSAAFSEALRRAYYYDEDGKWLGPEVDDAARWEAVTKVAAQRIAALEEDSAIQRQAFHMMRDRADYLAHRRVMSLKAERDSLRAEVDRLRARLAPYVTDDAQKEQP